MRTVFFFLLVKVITNVSASFLLLKKPVNQCVVQQRFVQIEQEITNSRGRCVIRCEDVNCFSMTYDKDTGTCRLYSLDGTDNVLKLSANCPTMVEVMVNPDKYKEVNLCLGFDVKASIMPKRYFKYVTESKTWFNANAHCISLKGKLVNILSEQEKDFFVTVATESTHIGLQYVSGQWYLNGDTNKPAPYFYWNDGEPNVLPTESAVTMYSNLEGGKWNNIAPTASDEKSYFICECPGN